MYKPEVAFYLGEQKQQGFSGIVQKDNLFFILEVGTGMSEDQGHKTLDFVKEKIKKINNFDDFIASIITENNLPSDFSIASGFIKDNILYLKTVGTGKVFIRRKNKLGLLIEGNTTASGPVENNDFFIFTTDNFFEIVGGRQGLENTFDHRSPTEIIDEITPSLKAKNDQGAVALFVNLHQIVEDDQVSFRPSPDEIGMTKGRIKSIWFSMKSSKKTLTFITVFILFLVFLWSVILGVQRRTSKSANEKIKLAKELVSQKLSTAEEVAFLNMDRALILIRESKEEVEKLKKDVPLRSSSFEGQLEKLTIMITQVENKILKKEQKKYSEFFDLTVDDKDAKGDKMYLDGENSFILDKKRGIIYRLSLEKKSLTKNQFSEIKSGSLVAGYGDEGFFYAKGSGVFRINSEGKLGKIVDNSNSWGEIIDIATYNGNVYLLDRGTDEVWKYLSGEEKYGSASSYFASGQAIDFSQVNSLAIDGSLYLAGDSIIVKYTSGLRDGFRVDLPDDQPNFNKVFTSRDLEKIYLWDKIKGTVYVLGKTGEYIEQINSDILSKGTDVVVYKEGIYVLVGSKIYEIN
ncbi:MAG: hypothetical protein US40_C0007G0009 [Candidatus Roizmanbacteria bacterium GW2011_GWC2_37_13]|uniref:Uncharacterized protein n=1 Tax=Candidatus Roizmanbacteria bacterium GW2011_GWC2_37_13 TaxID=1618486 RepID=A0A0G0GHE2_9BACT|nr:MAG: hypothetical protein US38_C0012G0012 [Candidatus Roizmanbacteria bacterium GW2011_GWC1_37_12]KKQ25510.1 MAG: hypothetical protein US40_C0007G0009 [Candidatus Roizmanbacteria bacterium GW2011_GWC2_37_13]